MITDEQVLTHEQNDWKSMFVVAILRSVSKCNDSNSLCVWSDTWQAMHQQHGATCVNRHVLQLKGLKCDQRREHWGLGLSWDSFSLWCFWHNMCPGLHFLLPQLFVNFALGYLICARLYNHLHISSALCHVCLCVLLLYPVKYEPFNQALRAVESSMSADLQAWDLEGPNVTPDATHFPNMELESPSHVKLVITEWPFFGRWSLLNSIGFQYDSSSWLWSSLQTLCHESPWILKNILPWILIWDQALDRPVLTTSGHGLLEATLRCIRFL